MKEFIKEILISEFGESFQSIYDKSPLIQYLDTKMGAIYGNAKTRRSLANIYAIYSILFFYKEEFYNKKTEYLAFQGYDFTKLFNHYRTLYGGEKLQNHALNSRVNGEFTNKFRNLNKELIVINNGKYALHVDYLYVENIDISKIAVRIIEQYIDILITKDNLLMKDIEELLKITDYSQKKQKINAMLTEDSEARIFEIISYAILKNHYKQIKVYLGFSRDNLNEEVLTLYKTGRTNANDGGIDFVMRPLGRFYQVTEVNSFDKYTLDMDKVQHYPITFVVKTLSTQEKVTSDLLSYIETKSGGMQIIIDRYKKAVEEILTINELQIWLQNLKDDAIDDLLRDIDLYYRLELNIPINTKS